ncbi:MAG: hypothetical protein IJF02_06160 [Oscillospiraceae bacterium]|nr:hypothetical protein [Oscillospiraceae bacterium]
MKQFLIFLLLPLLLAGCSRPPASGTAPSTTPTAPEPSGLYAPESELEQSTSGAVRYFPLDENTYSRILPMGDDLLLLSRDNTKLTLVTGSNLVPVVEKELPFHVQHIQTGSEGVAYLDEQNRTMVFLSTMLRETSRMQLPEGLIGKPWLTDDWKALYYCTASGLQRLNLDSGLSHLVTAQNSESQSVTGIYLNGSVIRCEITESGGKTLTRMISTLNGEILWEGTNLCEIKASEQNWFVRVDQGAVEELLFNRDDTVQNLWLEDTFSGILPLPAQNSVLTYQEASWGNRIHYYNLSTGCRVASVRLKGIRKIHDVCPDTSGNGIWLLAQNAALGTDAICHWTPNSSPTKDTTDYTRPHYTRSNPDEQGLQALQEQLHAFQNDYGISLLIGETISEPSEGVSVETEYLVPAYEEYLPILKRLIKQFPEGFFQKAAQRTPSGLLHIGLVRSFEGQVPNLPALHIRKDGDIWIVLALDESLEQNFYHSVSHMIETHLLSTSAALYDWDKLNPAGFSYDNDYKKNLKRDETMYLQGTDRSFADTFSMSFEREDRARILEYACMPGNEDLFQCAILQQKLQLICTGIRDAFLLDGDVYIWEQYLSPAGK